MHAFCYASGHIGFGDRIPDGALPLAKGERDALIAHVSGMARHAREGDRLFVPGMPEAVDDAAALEVMRTFVQDLTKNIPAGVETIYSAAAKKAGIVPSQASGLAPGMR